MNFLNRNKTFSIFITALLLCGIFSFISHDLTHAFEHAHQHEHADCSHFDAKEQPSNDHEDHDLCLQCVLASGFAEIAFPTGLFFIPVTEITLYDYYDPFFNLSADQLFCLRAPPSIL